MSLSIQSATPDSGQSDIAALYLVLLGTSFGNVL